MKKCSPKSIDRPTTGKRNEILSAASNSTTTGFTPEEIDVLRFSSTINGRSYKPFLKELDSNEKFFFPIQFT
jgi:hypothetical protein